MATISLDLDVLGIELSTNPNYTCGMLGPETKAFDSLGGRRSPQLCDIYSLGQTTSMSNHNSKTTLSELISPISSVLNSNPYARKSDGLNDHNWTIMGIKRVLSENTSGRSFLQGVVTNGDAPIWTGHYFNTLKSERRLANLEWTNQQLVNSDTAWIDCEDPISEHCPELDDFVIHMGDGHHHKAPVHEKKVAGKVYSTQHFYAKNIRNGMMWPIALAEYGYGRKKEHDMRALKRQTIEVLRAGASKGKKSLWLWDSACMCFPKWHEWKMRGIYFLTVEKELNEFININALDFDQEDTINEGVLKDQQVESGSKNILLRRVTYRCPDGKRYVFITNLHRNIRPGVIAFLYRSRWEIEKIYNTFKHKLNEQRAWAVSEVAKCMQANFICLTHNLALIMNRKVEREAPKPELSPNNEARMKREKRLNSAIAKNKKRGRAFPKLLLTASRITEMPKKFILWLRETIKIGCPWSDSIHRLEVLCVRRY